MAVIVLPQRVNGFNKKYTYIYFEFSNKTNISVEFNVSSFKRSAFLDSERFLYP